MSIFADKNEKKLLNVKVKHFFTYVWKIIVKVAQALYIVVFYILSLQFPVRTLLELVNPIVCDQTEWKFQWEVYLAVFGYNEQQGQLNCYSFYIVQDPTVFCTDWCQVVRSRLKNISIFPMLILAFIPPSF